MLRTVHGLLWLIIFICLSDCQLISQTDDFLPDLSGPYLGQTPPGSEPEVFAPGIVSTGLYERDLTMTPEGDEIYYCTVLGNYDHAVIVGTRQIKGKWTRPEIMPFAADPGYMYIEPHISPDGNRFFYVSNQPDSVGAPPMQTEDIWVMNRTENGWGAPARLPAPVNTIHAEYFPTLTKGGTLYFTRRKVDEKWDAIYRSVWIDGAWTEPERLGKTVNAGTARFNAFVDPDERFLIVPVLGLQDSRGSVDYYVCFRDENDIWTGPFNLGNAVNTQGGLEFSPYISPDGRYFFFMSRRLEPREGKLSLSDLKKWNQEPRNGNPDIYWMDASFIGQLKSK